MERERGERKGERERESHNSIGDLKPWARVADRSYFKISVTGRGKNQIIPEILAITCFNSSGNFSELTNFSRFETIKDHRPVSSSICLYRKFLWARQQGI